MCDFRVSRAELLRDYDTTHGARLETLFDRARETFGAFLQVTPEGACHSARGPTPDADDRPGLRCL